MKGVFILLCFFLLLAGCTPTIYYVQLYKPASENIKHTDDCFTFENDTLKIQYVFWNESGLMAFRIFNKTDKPLYIDWKKSNCVSNSLKFNYWADEAIENTIKMPRRKTSKIETRTMKNGFSFQFPSTKGYNSIGTSYSYKRLITTTTKEERITFLPPKSFIEKYGYKLMNDVYHFKADDKDYSKRIEPRNDNHKKKTTVFIKKFDKEDSPLNFRNFLTFSFKEDFSQEFHIDNEFYIKELESMDDRHFSYNVWDINDPNRNTDTCPYIKAINFYKLAY